MLGRERVCVCVCEKYEVENCYIVLPSTVSDERVRGSPRWIDIVKPEAY